VCREIGAHGLGSSIGETQVKLCAPMLTSHTIAPGERAERANDISRKLKNYPAILSHL
jgi:hypothetical protein